MLVADHLIGKDSNIHVNMKRSGVRVVAKVHRWLVIDSLQT